jgi:hypothetical protein
MTKQVYNWGEAFIAGNPTTASPDLKLAEEVLGIGGQIEQAIPLITRLSCR